MNEGLEALNEMRDEAVCSICKFIPRQVHKEVTEYFDKRKSTIEKELKALEIIKNKRVNVDLLYYAKNIDDYNRNIGTYLTIDRRITQEEYNLLKEVLL